MINWLAEGVRLPTVDSPQPFHSKNRHFNKKEIAFIDTEIKKLLDQKCMEKCSETYVARFVSPIQTVPKKQSFRLITDLRRLNTQCKLLLLMKI